MQVLLIGCGKTGSSVAKNIANLHFIKELLLYSRTVKSSKNLAAILKSSKIKIIEDLDSVKNVDYVIITLSGISDTARARSMRRRMTTYEVRQDELIFNIGAITDLTRYLKNIKVSKFIIVVTNPVDELTNYLRIKLKNAKVIGFGLDLDASRYSNELSKNVLCIGTHGRAVPLINRVIEKDYDYLLNKIDSKLLDYIRKNGIPHDVAGKMFRDFFTKLNGAKIQLVHASYYLKRSFAGARGISISLPLKVRSGEIIGVAEIAPNNIEKKKFVESFHQLRRSLKHILLAHKDLVSYK